MELASNLKILCLKTGRDEFARLYPHPWLLRELTRDESGMFTPTGATLPGIPVYPTTALRSRPVIASARMAWRVAREPQNFGGMPVIKTRANPWQSRILIGRAGNNDLVLSDESVSKLHAHLVRTSDGCWHLHDVSSANGTLVDGRKLSVGEGALMHSGAVLQFGHVRCEFIESAELYAALRGEVLGKSPLVL
jgi:hypothetical protein